MNDSNLLKILHDLQTAIVPFHFKRFIDGSQEHLTAMNAIKSLVRNTSRDVTFNKNSGDEGRVFFWAQISIAWEVDEVFEQIFLNRDQFNNAYAENE